MLLREVVRSGSRELFTLCILALALGVAFGSAELFGASLALGAFLAGVVLNESELSHRAGIEALPLRDAFAVLFFVSVGMLFDPSVLVDQPVRVAMIVTAVIVGKALAAFIIVTGLGYGLQDGVSRPPPRWLRSASSPSSWPRSASRSICCPAKPTA